MKLIDHIAAHVSHKQIVICLALVVGMLASVAAFALHWLIAEIEQLLTRGFDISSFNWWYLVLPVVGIWLTMMFVRYVVKDNISHGITRVLYALSTNQSKIRAHNTWTSIVASAITIGFGGSVGAEAPIVLTGSAIGSNLGQLFHLSRKQLMVLVGCGASAAIAAIFKAPIAGLVFTLEVLMVDLSMASLLPILTASVTATCFSHILMGDAQLFNFHIMSEWSVSRMPAYLLFGVLCALVSLYFIRAMSACEGLFEKLRQYAYVRLLLGGVMLSLLIFLFPPLYGEGYDMLRIFVEGRTEQDWMQVMNNSLFYGHNSLLLLYVGVIILTKVYATSATNGAGGCGGTFAPSLFIGGFTGFFFARAWNINNVGVYIPENNFTLLGMAGVMAGVMHAPLTGIFLIAEITSGYSLLMPLIIVSVCSVIFISFFEPHSIYAMRLAREGRLLTHHTDRSILTLMNMDSVIERDFQGVSPDMPLGKLVNAISRSYSSFIPVVDAGGVLKGEIDITKIRHIMFRSELYKRFSVSQIMTPVPAKVTVNDPMEEVMQKFQQHDTNYLPVVDVDNHLIGFISRSRAYSQYRNMVADFSAE